MTDMTELQAVHRVPKAIGEQKLKVVASSSIVPPAPPGLLGTNCLVRFAPQTRLVPRRLETFRPGGLNYKGSGKGEQHSRKLPSFWSAQPTNT